MLFQRKPTANPAGQNNTLYFTQAQAHLKPNSHDSVYCSIVYEEKQNNQCPVWIKNTSGLNKMENLTDLTVLIKWCRVDVHGKSSSPRHLIEQIRCRFSQSHVWNFTWKLWRVCFHFIIEDGAMKAGPNYIFTLSFSSSPDGHVCSKDLVMFADLYSACK